jgi:hypothetical protein
MIEGRKRASKNTDYQEDTMIIKKKLPNEAVTCIKRKFSSENNENGSDDLIIVPFAQVSKLRKTSYSVKTRGTNDNDEISSSLSDLDKENCKSLASSLINSSNALSELNPKITSRSKIPPMSSLQIKRASSYPQFNPHLSNTFEALQRVATEILTDVDDPSPKASLTRSWNNVSTTSSNTSPLASSQSKLSLSDPTLPTLSSPPAAVPKSSSSPQNESPFFTSSKSSVPLTNPIPTSISVKKAEIQTHNNTSVRMINTRTLPSHNHNLNIHSCTSTTNGDGNVKNITSIPGGIKPMINFQIKTSASAANDASNTTNNSNANNSRCIQVKTIKSGQINRPNVGASLTYVFK